MKRRTFLKLAATSLATLVSETVYAQEEKVTITVNRKKYYVYPNRENNRIEDENGKTPEMGLQAKIIRTYLINKQLQNYLPTVQKNLKELNRTIDSSRISEVKRKCKEIPKEAIDDIVQNIKNPAESTLEFIIKKFKIAKSLYKVAKRAILSIYVDPKMYLYAEVTTNLLPAERQYQEFKSLLEQGLTDSSRAEKALELLVESEHLITVSTNAFQIVNSSKNLEINQRDYERFAKLIDMEDTEEVIQLRKDLCSNVRVKARQSQEYKDYTTLLIKAKSGWYSFQQNLKNKAGTMFSQQSP